MSMTRQPRITVGIPVFRGASIVGDALESVAAQTHANLRVVVSVDGRDVESAAVCRRYARDPRFEIVVQSEQLGWAGNVNWIMRQVSTEFAVYLAQDDRVEPTCYEILLDEARAHPDAVVISTYIQWFGAKAGVQTEPAVHGTPFERMLTAIECGVWFPFLGLRRMSAARRTGDLLVDRDDSAMEDVNWVLKMLWLGPVRQIPMPLYHKRAHGGMVTAGKQLWDQERARRIWIEAWARLFVTALGAAESPVEARRLATAVMRRVAASSRDMDWFFRIDERTRGERQALARDFVSHLARAVEPLDGPTGALARGLPGQIAELMPSILGFWGSGEDAARPVLERTRIALDGEIAAGGWHPTEAGPGGEPFRWTGPGAESEIPLNILLDRPYRVRAHIVHLVPGVPADQIVFIDDGLVLDTQSREMAGMGPVVEAIVRPHGAAPARELRLALRVPLTQSPQALGINSDRRLLGCAVDWIEVEPCDT
jgi:hypothetical protein